MSRACFVASWKVDSMARSCSASLCWTTSSVLEREPSTSAMNLSFTCSWTFVSPFCRTDLYSVTLEAISLSSPSNFSSKPAWRCHSFVTRCLTNLKAVFDSVVLKRYMASMNSCASISPELSLSMIWKSCSKSAESISITRSRCRNSATLRAPALRSSKETTPSMSVSILVKILKRSSFSFLSSYSISTPRLSMSFSLSSAAVSTTTAVTRLSTPNTRVSREPMKMTAVQGWCSMIGMAILPQLSPAMTVWKSVIFAWVTEAKDRRHLSQSAHWPWLSASSMTKG
mmetsp:Transcript_44934/g.121043  ORF Transcript_44934/g.121043 Transcript_44934/m.121043 type:complete len:285 (+) Transcript_44934:712-1566(+)